MFSMAQQANLSQSTRDKNQRDNVLAQLTDMFGDSVPQEIIQSVGNANNWKLDDCVEHLIQYDPQVTRLQQEQTIVHDADDADILIESEEIQQQPTIALTPTSAIFPSSPLFKNTGAIPKSRRMEQTECPAVPMSNSHPFPQPNANTNSQPSAEKSFSSLLKNNSAGNQFVDNCLPRQDQRHRAIIPDHPDMKKAVYDINQGYRVMVVMRGAPGSGKSHLARSIIDQTVNEDYENYIFSTDDFFYDKKQKRYVYNPDFLEAAHNANQAKVAQKALNGWSPIIIDNTNIKLWEMIPYVREGVNNGYLINMLEPNTAWARAPGKLEMRNKHNVPRHTIERMLSTFETTTPSEFLTLMRLDYSHPLPVFRNYPRIVDGQIAKSEKSSQSVGLPKEQRKRQQPQPQQQPFIFRNVVEKNASHTFRTAAEQIHTANNQWAAFDTENGFVPWDAEQLLPVPTSSQFVPKEKRMKPVMLNQPPQLNGIYNLLRDRHDSTLVPEQSENTDEDDEEINRIKLVKHEKGCPNENESFQQIRQIYPNISISFLWDLFEKCNGDGDWTMDILLKDEDTTTNFNDLETPELREDNFKCDCKSGGVHELQLAANVLPATLFTDNPEPTATLPQPPVQNIQAKTSRRDRVETESESQIRRQIEEQFDISDDVYSPHVRKIRDFRRGIVGSPIETESSASTLQPLNMDVDAIAGDEIAADGDELIEVDLGIELVCQLDNVFGADAFQRENLKDMKTTVFMPRTLGQQLYAIWMESLYNQIEEQRQTSVREDEEFAKQLQLKDKYPKLLQKTTSTNLKDIMEMEYAWKAYKSDVDEWKKTTPQDLASKMTRSKLFELFPNINRETLVEILTAHDNKFGKTVEVLKSSLESDIENQVEADSQRLLSQVNVEAQSRSNIKDSSLKSQRALEAKKLGPEEAKRMALRDFEENRNMAMHHSHLKAECYAKAKEAFQRHDGQVAYYYTNVANLHKNKIDMYNQMAANAIAEVHSFAHQNPDMLDLHYLHSAEAIECLDIFLDRQIMQVKFKKCKYVFVITGRGLHSAGGFSTIKARVKSRLRERSLTWSEVNPGLLKVRLFPNSPYAKDV